MVETILTNTHHSHCAPHGFVARVVHVCRLRLPKVAAALRSACRVRTLSITDRLPPYSAVPTASQSVVISDLLDAIAYEVRPFPANNRGKSIVQFKLGHHHVIEFVDVAVAADWQRCLTVPDPRKAWVCHTAPIPTPPTPIPVHATTWNASKKGSCSVNAAGICSRAVAPTQPMAV